MVGVIETPEPRPMPQQYLDLRVHHATSTNLTDLAIDRLEP